MRRIIKTALKRVESLNHDGGGIVVGVVVVGREVARG